MDKMFYEYKRESKKNFSSVSAILLSFLFLLLGDLIAVFLGDQLSALFHYHLIDNLEFQLFMFAPTLIIVLAWARLVEKSPWEGLGFIGKHKYKDFFKGYLLGAVMLTLCVMIMMIFGVVEIVRIDFSVKMLLRTILLFFAWTVQSSTEEILNRGWLFSSISAKSSIAHGIITSSLFFAALHLGNEGIGIFSFLDLFLFGIFTTLYMLKTNNIWGVCGFHSAWNFFQGSIFAFPVSGNDVEHAFIKVKTYPPDWLSGGIFGVEGSVISNLVQLLVILILLYQLGVFGSRQNVFAQEETRHAKRQ